MRGQNGVEFYQESTGHVRFFLALLLANQWDAENCQAQVQSQIQVQNTGSKFKIQSPTTTHNFPHLKCQYSDGKRPSMTLLDLPRPSMTVHDLPWPSMTFYHLLRPLWPSMYKCIISEPLKSKPQIILTEFQGLTLSTQSLKYLNTRRHLGRLASQVGHLTNKLAIWWMNRRTNGACECNLVQLMF